MKTPHNFITPLPPKEEQALYQWYTYSVYAITVCILFLLGINGYQYWNLRKTHEAYATLQATLREQQQSLQQQEPLKEQHAQLQEQLKTLEELTTHAHNPLEVLGIIEKAIPGDACLTEFNYQNNGDLAMHGYAHTAETVLNFLTAMQEAAALQNLELASLAPVKFQEQDKTWYQFHIKAGKAQKNAL